jgi:hypothetical protein
LGEVSWRAARGTAAGGRQGPGRGRMEGRARDRRRREKGAGRGPCAGPPPEGGRELGEVVRRAVRGTAARGRQGSWARLPWNVACEAVTVVR